MPHPGGIAPHRTVGGAHDGGAAGSLPGEAVEPAAEQAASVATARQATAAIQMHVLKPKVSLLSSAPLVSHRER